MTVALRPYQNLAIDAFQQSQKRRKLVVFSTGLGKTITGLALAQRRGQRTLWLAHREELITQPARSLGLVWPEASYGIVKADLNQYMRQVVFASIQSAQQPKRIAQLAEQGFDLVVVDEAHHAMSPGYMSLLKALRCFENDGPQLLGLTATPERSDSGALEDVFEEIVFQMGITTAIETGYLIAPRVLERRINVDLDAITVTRGDFGQKQLDLALMQAGIVDELAATYDAHCAPDNRKTLIFVVSVAQAEATAAELKKRGHRAVALSGETPSEERRSILKKLGTGEIMCVCNCMVLTEGFDEPSIDCIVLARPTQSKPLMIQMVGRGLRLYPGKTDCLVIDMVGASNRHTLVQAAVLFGMRPDPTKTPRSGPPDINLDPDEYWRQRYLAQINGMGGAPRSKLRWLPTADSIGWLLPAGEYGTIRMMPQGGEWIVDAVGARDGGPSNHSLSAVPVSLETAQAIAEDFVRRVKAVGMATSNAAWRDGPATEAQIKILTRNKIKCAGMTKGTASDLLTQIEATKATEPVSNKQAFYLRRNGVQVRDGMTKREASKEIAKLRAMGR